MTDEVAEWMSHLDDETYDRVNAAIDILTERGPMLGRPLVDSIKASEFKNMKELRPGSSGNQKIRVLFAFDPNQQAILLIGGDKSGEWTRWYKTNIPLADRVFTKHLKELKP